MFILRVLLLIVVFTCFGVALMYFTDFRPVVEGTFAYLQGNAAFKDEEYEQAGQFYATALEGYPNKGEVYLRIADTQLKQGHQRAAVQSLQNALREKPDNVQALCKLAEIEWERGHQRVAIGLYREAYELAPKNSSIADRAGQLYVALAKTSEDPSDYDKATVFLRQVVQQHPQDDNAKYLLAEALYAQQEYDEVLSIYCDLAPRHADNAETLYSLGVMLARNGAYKEAYAMMAKAVEYAELEHPELADKWARQAMRYKRGEDAPDSNLPENIKHCLSLYQDAEKKIAENEK